MPAISASSATGAAATGTGTSSTGGNGSNRKDQFAAPHSPSSFPSRLYSNASNTPPPAPTTGGAYPYALPVRRSSSHHSTVPVVMPAPDPALVKQPSIPSAAMPPPPPPAIADSGLSASRSSIQLYQQQKEQQNHLFSSSSASTPATGSPRKHPLQQSSTSTSETASPTLLKSNTITAAHSPSSTLDSKKRAAGRPDVTVEPTTDSEYEDDDDSEAVHTLPAPAGPTKEELELRKRRKRYKIIAATIACLLLFFTTVAVFGVLNSKEGNLRLQTAFTSKPAGKSASEFNRTANPLRDTAFLDVRSPEYICNNFDLVQVFANVSAVDTTGGTMKLHFLFFPCGKFSAVDPVQSRANLAMNMNITIDSKVFIFSKDLPMSSQDLSTRFARGDPNNYPIETYVSYLSHQFQQMTALPQESTTFFLSGTYLDPDTSTLLPVPLTLSIVGALQTFSIDIPEATDVSDGGRGTLVGVKVRVVRSFTTKAFSVFVMVVMWVLSVLTFCLAMSPWIRRFALPAIRNSQPGVPAIGCTADVVSFFWCEMLTAASSLLMVSNFIYYTYYPPTPPPSSTPATVAAAVAAAAAASAGAGGVERKATVMGRRPSGAAMGSLRRRAAAAGGQ
ncbi:hypothetical protein HDU96_010014 [Phlyctochytrium bullatum]|nr:hypothetical protein HDU96_010014 [Phlyctochytrium bullatum]